VIRSTLEGVVPNDRIYGTQFNYDPGSGEIQSVAHLPAGYGEVAKLDELQATLQIGPDRIIYVGQPRRFCSWLAADRRAVSRTTARLGRHCDGSREGTGRAAG
jgi:hypothetical protein